MRQVSPAVLLFGSLVGAPLTAQTFVRKIPDLPALYQAFDVAVEPGGNLWVVLSQSWELVKLSPAGQELLRVGRQISQGGPGVPAFFNLPVSVAVGPMGDVYVGDRPYVLRFDATGRLVSFFGGAGTGSGQFAAAAGGVAVAPNGDVYAVDTGGHRVHRFNRVGSHLGTFGSFGALPGQFDFSPTGGNGAANIDVDAAGSLYILDAGNSRVQKLDPSGTPLLSFAVAGVNTQGASVAVDPAGFIYASSFGFVKKYDPSGTYVADVATGGSSDGRHQSVRGIAADAAGNLFTADAIGRVQKFSATGSFVARFGTPGSNNPGQFASADDVAFTSSGEILVADFSNRVQRFDLAGSLLATITLPGLNSGILALDAQDQLHVAVSQTVRKLSPTGSPLLTIGTPGTGNGQFQNISGIAVDAAGNTYVADATQNRVQKFAPTGAFVMAFGSTGAADGQLNQPRGLAVAANGDLWVADYANQRIQRFDAGGSFLGKITAGGLIDFAWPFSVAIDQGGFLFVGSYGNHRLHVFNSAGAYVTKNGPFGGGDGAVQEGSGVAVRNGVLAMADRINNRVQLFDVTNLDTQVPIVSITSPAPGAVLGSFTVPVSGTVTDLSTTTVSSSPGGVFAQLPAGGGAVAGSVTFTGSDGSRLITLSALDATGRTGGTSVAILIDTTLPTATVTSPIANAVLSAALASVSVSVTDATATTVTFSHGGSPVALNAGGGTATAVVTLTNGANTITVLVTDAAGNQRTVTRTVTADLSAPIVAITTPLDGSTFGAGAALVPVLAQVDDLSATTVSSTPAGVAASLPAGGGSATGAIALVEGTNTITVTASDAFQRTGTASISVVLDTTGPAVAFDSPAAGALVRGTLDVTATATDPLPGSGVASVAFAVDGNPLTTDSEAPFELVLDTTTLADGSHTLTAVASDGKGNTTGAQVPFVVDNTPPTLAITAPTANAVVGGTSLGITADAADSGTGLKTVTFLVGSVAPAVDGSVTYATPVATATPTAQEDTTRWPDGPRLITVTAVDDAGNQTTATLSVIVDNTAPVSALVSPTDGAQVAGIVPIVAQSTEPNLLSLVIKVDGVVVGSTGANALTVPFDTAGRPAGPMLIEVIVTDLANHQSTASATVQVVNFTFDLEPEKLELKSKERGTVTAHVEGAAVAALLPIRSHVIELRVRGGNPVRVQSSGNHHDEDDNRRERCGRSRLPDVELRFDRQTFIASIRAGIAAGYLPATGTIPVELVVDGVVLATSSIRVKSCEHRDCREHQR